MRRTTNWEARIDALDPDSESDAIVAILIDHVFTEDFLASMELGQLTTFGIPSISKVLHGTRQYEEAGTKRLDDTLAMGLELFKGLQTPQAAAMLEHLNAIHSHYPITNDDNLYTLSTLSIDLDRWLSRYGFRQLREIERRALHRFAQVLGGKMNITDIPATHEAFVAWRLDYEATHRRFHPNNMAVASGAAKGLAAMLPVGMRWLTLPLLASLVDEELRAALGLRKAPLPFRVAVAAGMRARRWTRRFFNAHEHRPFRQVRLLTQFATYPNGYDPMQLGPTKVLRAMAKRKGCPMSTRARVTP